MGQLTGSRLQAGAHAAPKSPKRRRRLILLAAAALLLAPLGYRSFVTYQIRRHVWECAEARESADWARVEEMGLRLTRWDGQNAMPWLLAAEGAQGQGSLKRAAEYLEQIPESDSRAPSAFLELGNLYFGALNRPGDGEAACQRALRINPQLGEAHRRLVFYYAATLQRPKLIRQAREAIAQRCDIPETYIYLVGADWINLSNAYELNGIWAQGAKDPEIFEVAQLIHWTGAAGLDEAAGFTEDADSNTKRVAEHERMLRECLERYPSNSELLAYFLKQTSTKGETERVAELLARIPKSAAEDNRFWRYKGWLHAALGEIEKAEAAYRKALKLNPYDWHSQHELAAVLRRDGRLAEVETLARLAIEGKNLRKAILQLPDVQSAPRETLEQIRHYAQGCGDVQVVARLEERIKMLQ